MESRPTIVVGIDAGYANLAFVVVSTENISRPVFHGRFRILAGKYSEVALLDACEEFFKRPDIVKWMERADQIMLEYQKDRKFHTVNMFAKVKYFNKTSIVHPNTVGAHFKLAKDRKEKKKDAVALFQSNTVIGSEKGKKDDLADAYLLTIYYLQQNFELGGWKALEDGKANVRRPAVVSDREPEQKRARQQSEDCVVYPGYQQGFLFL